MKSKLSRGAKIVVDHWLEVKTGERLLIVTCDKHREEIEVIRHYALLRHAQVEVMSFPDQSGQVGHYFDEHEDAFDAYDVVLGATTHSLVTTRAVKRAINLGKRFLSLPLSTNDLRSMLEYEFLLMDTKKSKQMGDFLLNALNQSKTIRVTTEAGTDLIFFKRGRDAQFFNGSTKQCAGYASSSFEVFVPVEEDKTKGVAYVDASLGYIGKTAESVRLILENGRITDIEENSTGIKLKEYMEAFEDEGMYVAGEFGIGLNMHAKCEGHCYIEDESTYGTFHIGFGRNIALGGIHNAKAHFDLVFHKPDIYADNCLIMRKGEIYYPGPTESNELEVVFV